MAQPLKLSCWLLPETRGETGRLVLGQTDGADGVAVDAVAAVPADELLAEVEVAG